MTDVNVEVTNENVDQLLAEQQKADEQAPTDVKPDESQTTEQSQEKKHDGPEPKVPLGALHEERMRRKAAEAQMQELRRQNEEYNKWRAQNEQILAERLAALQPKPQIDPVENPVGFLANQQAETQKLIAQFQEEQRQQQEQQRHNAALQQFTHIVTTSEQQFAKEKPDYFEAVNYAKAFKAKEYMTFGYSEQEAKQLVDQDAIGIAQRALQLGENPANLAYQYALTAGYKPSVNAEQKLNMMEAGQKASKPSGGSGKSPTPSLEALLAMSDDDSYRATKDDNAFKKLVGG